MTSHAYINYTRSHSKFPVTALAQVALPYTKFPSNTIVGSTLSGTTVKGTTLIQYPKGLSAVRSAGGCISISYAHSVDIIRSNITACSLKSFRNDGGCAFFSACDKVNLNRSHTQPFGPSMGAASPSPPYLSSIFVTTPSCYALA